MIERYTMTIRELRGKYWKSKSCFREAPKSAFMLFQRVKITHGEVVANVESNRELPMSFIVFECAFLNKQWAVNQIHAERTKRADTWVLNHALASFQDAMAEIARVGWTIANDEMADGRDRAAALREIREAYNLMFEKFFDAGVFERKLGTLDATIRNTPLPERPQAGDPFRFPKLGAVGRPKEDAKPAEPASSS